MIAPVDAPEGPIAWNSFAYVADRQDGGTDLLPAEPRKVGIEVEYIPNDYGDRVWLDVNKNGLQDDGEVGINGISVSLYDAGAMARSAAATTASCAPPSPPATASATMGSTSSATCRMAATTPSSIRRRSYSISPANQTDSDPQTVDDQIDSDFIPATGFATHVAVLSGAISDFRWDAGLYPSETAALGNYVWFDADGDGQQNESLLAGVNGVEVTLYDADDDQPVAGVDPVFTADDANGNPGFYLFENLAAGDYYVVFTLPASASGFTTSDPQIDDAVDSDADPTTGATGEVELRSATTTGTSMPA
jgi:hypothetical protein